jgi:hypothetical protein
MEETTFLALGIAFCCGFHSLELFASKGNVVDMTNGSGVRWQREGDKLVCMIKCTRCNGIGKLPWVGSDPARSDGLFPPAGEGGAPNVCPVCGGTGLEKIGEQKIDGGDKV